MRFVECEVNKRQVLWWMEELGKEVMGKMRTNPTLPSQKGTST